MDESEYRAATLDPSSTALLVVDFQNDFCAPGGFYDQIGYDLSMGQAAARRTVEFLPVAREAGVLVVFLRCVYDAPYVSDMMRRWYELRGFPLEYCQDGQWGCDFYEVEPAAGDLVVTKHRYSGFTDTELQAILRSNNIRNLVLTGVATNVCVESTARDAFMADYHVALVSDCCGTYSEALHEATLETTRRAFGLVLTASEVAEVWQGARAAAPAGR